MMWRYLIYTILWRFETRVLLFQIKQRQGKQFHPKEVCARKNNAGAVRNREEIQTRSYLV